MQRTTDRTLLSPDLRARLEAGGVTNGEYHRLLPTFPDAALCDHAEVYAGHCMAASLPADQGLPEAWLHHFILPALVARLRGSSAPELSQPDPDSPFRRLCRDWNGLRDRILAGIQEQRRLASLTGAELAAAAEAARAAVDCRWAPRDLVYDGAIYHTLIPELMRRVAKLPSTRS
ncbi:hypothetical protein [Longimicrobium terrae]|uniref:Uncharacterized protein n=1 Tax=Longimicrobium terrae TaxID=1639882 RepID=A0A841GWS6_9BACT|nr:hypothetical protein [Longimicrobium terrae]MBB4635877.1 hypothetical protein [Longimicrobium terrae]MBB6070273.1 hypothetical protein [Longimicrobium terrae]NNC30777.1 hypothetical protein [Longimicrobium terrae]